MRSKKSSAIITAYAALFTFAVGVVADDLATHRDSRPVQYAARQLPAAQPAARPPEAPRPSGTVAMR